MNSQQQPTVTVVTVVFNLIKAGREDHFRQCLTSVREQTYPHIEHVIIDGASNDGTLDLIKAYQTRGWVQCLSEPDQGVYDAMNKGLRVARGRYIAYLNSDDHYHRKDAVALSVAALERADADYSFANTAIIANDSDRLLSNWKGKLSHLPFGTHYCHQTLFAKTSVLRELGGFDLSYRVSADSDLMIKLVSHGKRHVRVPHTLIAYRDGGLSANHQAQSRTDHARAFHEHLGKALGLTEVDCQAIWQFSALREQSPWQSLKLGFKLKRVSWILAYLKAWGQAQIRSKQ